MKIYTVWVGGIEATDYLVNYQQANEILKSYLDDGYTDGNRENREEGISGRESQHKVRSGLGG